MSFIPPYRTPTDDYTQTSTDTSGGFYGSRYPGLPRINNMPIIGSDALFPSIQKILERYAAMDNFDPNVQGKQLAEELSKDPNVRGFTDPDSVMMNERGEVVDKEEEEAEEEEQSTAEQSMSGEQIPDRANPLDGMPNIPAPSPSRGEYSDADANRDIDYMEGRDAVYQDFFDTYRNESYREDVETFQRSLMRTDVGTANNYLKKLLEQWDSGEGEIQNPFYDGEENLQDIEGNDLTAMQEKMLAWKAAFPATWRVLTSIFGEDMARSVDRDGFGRGHTRLFGNMPRVVVIGGQQGVGDGSSESPYSGSDRLLETEYDKEVWDQTSKDYEEGKDITVCEGDICYTVNKRTHDIAHVDAFITTETGTYGTTNVTFSPKTGVDIDAPEETDPTEETNQDDTEEGGRDSGGSPGGKSGDPGGEPGEEGREGGSPSGVPTEGGGPGPGGGEGTSRVPTLPGGAQTPDDEGNKNPPEEPIYTGDEPLGPDEVEVIIWIPEDKRTPENIEAFCDAYPGFCEAWEKTTGEPYDGSPMATKRPMTEEEILEREREKAEQEQSGGQPSGQPSGQPGGPSGGLGSPSSNTRNAIDWLIRTAANARDIANAGRSSSDTTGEGAATGDTGGTSDTGDGSASTEGTGDGGEDGGTGDGGDGGDGDDAGSGDTTGSGEGGEGDGTGDGTGDGDRSGDDDGTGEGTGDGDGDGDGDGGRRSIDFSTQPIMYSQTPSTPKKKNDEFEPFYFGAIENIFRPVDIIMNPQARKQFSEVGIASLSVRDSILKDVLEKTKRSQNRLDKIKKEAENIGRAKMTANTGGFVRSRFPDKFNRIMGYR